MKTILVAALTADGYIGRSANEPADWTSKQDKGTFVRLTREAGVMVMGANTFATIGRALPGRRTIVYTHHPERINVPGIETTTEAPADLIARLSSEGAGGLAVCGGTQIYSLFIQADLIDELYLTTEPVLMGQGIQLFNAPLAHHIELLETTIRKGRTIVNHYRVIRPASAP